MGKEHFKNLYPVIEAIVNSKAGDLTEVMNVLNRTTDDMIKEEARKILEFMDNYKKPEIPFQHITEDLIQKTCNELKEQYGFIIWESILAGTDVDCAQIVQTDPDYYLGYSEDDIRSLSIETNNEDRNLLMEEFNKIPINGLIITGTIGRWNGPKLAFGIRNSLNELFEVFTNSYDCILYIKDGQLQGENHHHDGTDHYTFYTCKKGVDPESIAHKPIMNINTDVESLIPALVKHFELKLED